MDQPEASAQRVTVAYARDADAVQPVLDRLGAVLGPHSVLRGTDAEPYLVEDRGLFHGQAFAVVRPDSTEMVAAAVRIAAEAGLAIVPQGGNTGLVGGQSAFAGSIVLSLQRMNRIRAVDPVNGTIAVDAGCILKSVQDEAARHDMLFPLSLASEGSCLIGGNIASNAGGTAVLRYGNTRDLVLGLEVVLPDGRIWNGMRGLRKDNAGYDLKQLFIGSEGTLGVITGAVLKLYPRPRARATAFAGCADAKAVLAFFELARGICGDVLTAFEFMPRFGLDLVTMSGKLRDPLSEPFVFYVLVELSSVAEAAGLDQRLQALLEEGFAAGLIGDATIATSEAQASALWSLREELSGAQKLAGGSIKHDVSVPVSRVATFIERASAACEAALPGIRVCAFGHIGDGNVHFNLSQPVAMDKAAFLANWSRINAIVHAIAVELDGSIAAEHGIGVLKRESLSHYKDEVSLDLMRALKAAIDPMNRMNPGKIIPTGRSDDIATLERFRLDEPPG